MISGIMQSDAEKQGKEVDYLGILYPEGHIGEQFQYLFNHEDIKEIVFRGYEDAERSEFIEKLGAYAANITTTNPVTVAIGAVALVILIL